MDDLERVGRVRRIDLVLSDNLWVEYLSRAESRVRARERNDEGH
jgi:hypothetical protein